MRPTSPVAMFLLSLAAIMAAALTGCGSRHDTVHGQVFIVTMGRENLRLGLVTVELLSEDAVVKHIASREEAFRMAAAAREETLRQELARAAGQREALRPELDRAAAALSVAEGRRLAAERVAAEAARAFQQAKDHAERLTFTDPNYNVEVGKVIWKPVNDARPRLEQAEADVERATEAARKSDQEYQSVLARTRNTRPSKPSATRPSAAFYFSGMPPAIASAQTDADGRFALRVPRRVSFVLAARAERLVMGEREQYYWLIRLTDAMRSGTPILLANEALTTGNSELSLVHTLESTGP